MPEGIEEADGRAEEDWFDAVPKVELHLHLEGAIPRIALLELVRKYGVRTSLSELEERFRYRDFAHFLDTWAWMVGFLRELEDFSFIAEAVARDLARQRVRYVEAFFSPGDHARQGVAAAEVAAAIRAGLDRVPAVRVNLVADLVRNYGPENGARLVEELAEAVDLGVVGIGIGGSEAEFPPEPFAAVYERARELGFRTSAHAGEAAGAASVWGAIRALKVDRIGHGTRAAEDPELVEHLARERIPIEMCPVSNVRTRVVASLQEHPVRRFFDQGLLVTVNSDDPALFGTSLANEYRQLAEVLGFSRDEVRQVILNGVESCWLDDEEKARLRAELLGDPGW